MPKDNRVGVNVELAAMHEQIKYYCEQMNQWHGTEAYSLLCSLGAYMGRKEVSEQQMVILRGRVHGIVGD